MFDILWGKLKGVKEGRQIPYPLDRQPSMAEARQIAYEMDVNDYVICPDRKQAQRIYGFIKRHRKSKFEGDVMTRSVIHNGKECIKVWRIR
tara:strand:+ start:127 stop:399 length:273 start_codon:yes stop_codon:yes gene_type:complete